MSKMIFPNRILLLGNAERDLSKNKKNQVIRNKQFINISINKNTILENKWVYSTPDRM